jgi:16S rRNA processing protein RimM
VKVHSYTDPRDGILRYRVWHLRGAGGWQPFERREGRVHGKGIVARLAGIEDRDQARAMIGVDVAVPRCDLPPLGGGEYYWTDLIGLRVETMEGRVLGLVERLFDTGSNDVLVVSGERERWIPFILDQVVRAVEPDEGRIRVDWDPDF